MTNYETVSEAVSDLIKRGYTENFIREEGTECRICDSPSICLPPEYYTIDEVHRFEGATDPADEMIVFAISSEKLLLKGIVVNAYGVYVDTATSRIVQDLKIQAH
ncbi:MAG: phosphoribosylpyrophosphate synthetase [Chitinophagaceae bacterium]